MDPIAHTLVGGALARSGLSRRTPVGTATLLIGANLPDVDVAAYAWGPETALWFRRGLTHGVLAILVLPLALAALMLLWDRAVRRRRRPGSERARFRALWLLSVMAVGTHPLLDYLNVYGIRLLAPFSDRWFYGDALFIVDPWLWAILGAGCWLARRGNVWPCAALGVATLYALVLGASGMAAERLAVETARGAGVEPARVMAAPLLLTPRQRRVVVEGRDGAYRIGFWSWSSEPRVELARLPYETAGRSPILRAATRIEGARRFLSWARFPFFSVRPEGDGYRVFIADARYGFAPEGSWAATSVWVRREDLAGSAARAR